MSRADYSGRVISVVSESDLDELLTLMRAYCDFYDVAPADEALLAMARTLIADPQNEGVQLIARDDAGVAVGFTTVFWTWSTLRASRIGVMHDLFVAPTVRGQGIGAALIAGCLEQCRGRGATALTWQTAPDNARAQALYGRVGAQREQWVDYWLEA